MKLLLAQDFRPKCFLQNILPFHIQPCIQPDDTVLILLGWSGSYPSLQKAKYDSSDGIVVSSLYSSGDFCLRHDQAKCISASLQWQFSAKQRWMGHYPSFAYDLGSHYSSLCCLLYRFLTNLSLMTLVYRWTYTHIRVQQDVNMCCRCEVCRVVWHWDPGMCPTDSFRPDREGLWCSRHSRRLLFKKYGWQVKMLWLKLYLCVWNWGGVCHTFFSFSLL